MLTSFVCATVLVGITVTLHYEALNLLSRTTRSLRRHRGTLLLVMFGLLTAHVIEIWVWAVGYFVAENYLAAGNLAPAGSNMLDYAYFSSMVYTTVGFGDIIPSGRMRLLTASEALTGLALITWSASYTFFHMSAAWDGNHSE